MLTTIMASISQWNHSNKVFERFEQSHPFLSILLFQILVGLGLICAVGGIAGLGGSIIWMFYRLMGTM